MARSASFSVKYFESTEIEIYVPIPFYDLDVIEAFTAHMKHDYVLSCKSGPDVVVCAPPHLKDEIIATVKRILGGLR